MINHISDVPVYKQLQEILEQDIYDGKYKLGDKLPSENELCEKYGVSRTTVRQTLTLLAQKDMIHSVHGKGSFVKMPEFHHELSKIVSFGSILERQGLKGYTKILKTDSKSSNEKATAILGSKYFNMSLMGYAKDAPIVYYDSYIKADLRSEMRKAATELEESGVPFSTFDLYPIIGKKLGSLHQLMRATAAAPELAKYFESPRGLILMELESVYYDENGIPLEYKLAYYRSDVYSFEIKREL